MANRTIAFTLALAGAGTTLGTLWPSPLQLADLRVRAATTPEERVRALEARRALAPADRALVLRLVEGYAQAGRADAGLSLIEAEAGRRELSRDELAAGRRLALAIGQPRRALALHLGPHARRKAGELTSLVDLALMAGDPGTALRLQRELAAARPADPQVAERARDLALMAGDLQAAIAAQTRLLALTPTPALADRLASLALQAGDPKGALDALERVPAGGPAFHYRAAQLAEWSGQPARAVPHLRALYDATPKVALGRRLAAALARAGDPSTLEFALALVRRFPAEASLRQEAADRLVAVSRGPEALELMRQAVDRRPGNVAAHDALVDFALGHNLLDGAVVELGRWVAANPRDPVALSRLAEVLGWQGRAREASDVYERLFATCKPPAALEVGWRRAWLALATPEVDRTAGGRANLEALLAREPNQPALRRRLALARWAAGDHEGAILAQRELPDAADRATLAGWLTQTGRAREGLAILEACRAELPPLVLADAAYEAAREGAWPEAGLLFGQLARRKPKEPGRWADLATALEAEGDAAGAAEAWRRRLALGGGRVGDQLRYVRLLTRAARERDALAVFAAQPWAALDATALADGAALARGQGDRALEERALRALLGRRARDLDARLRLVELLDRRGARAEADLQAGAAAGLAGADARVLLPLAGRAVYGGRPAGTLLERLAALPDPPAGVYAVLADAFEVKAPARAADALDGLHRLTGGTAATWLRRGDLASRLGQLEPARLAWLRALELAEEPTEQRAWALERLGRADEAADVWEVLARRSPAALTPALALARRHVDRGELDAAAPLVARVQAIAPKDPAVRRLQADFLARGQHPDQALAVARGLPQDAGVMALEAQLHHDLGQTRQAAQTAQAAVLAEPGLEPALRPLRLEAATRPRAVARVEHLGGEDRVTLGADASMLLGENTRLRIGLDHDQWAGVASHELTLGLSQPLASATLEGELGLVDQAPVGHVGLRWANGSVTVGESRWLDAPATAVHNGRERSVAADVRWQPTPAVSVGAGAGVGRLALDGVEVGTSTSARAEVAVKPAPAPVTLAYQFNHRGWGSAAPLVGLPATADAHGVLARYDASVGPVRLSLAPGYALDAASGAGAPTFTGGLTWTPAANAELSLTGAFAGRSFDQGLADAYRLFELAASIAF